MAIVRTKPFVIVGILENREQILKKLQVLECVQVEKIENLKYLTDSNLIERLNDVNEKIKDAENCIEILNEFNTGKKTERKHAKIQKIQNLKYCEENFESILKTIKYIIKCEDDIKNLQKEVEKIENEKLHFENYLTLNTPTKILNTKNVNYFIGEILGSFTQEELVLKFKEIENSVYVKVICNKKLTTTLFLISNKNFYEKAKSILYSLNFVKAPEDVEKTPKEKVEYCEENIKILKNEIESLKNEIKFNLKNLQYVELITDYLNIEKERYETIIKTISTKNTFILKGFVNPKREKKLEDIINKFNSYIEISKPNENSPVFFYNNFIVAPMQNITKTYSMPSHEDIDPNPVMSFFYYIFFGMMFSDAGYGIILSLFCLIFMLNKNASNSKKQLFKMFFMCGISTTFWGFMYGSFFGDMLQLVSKTFFNKNFYLPPLFINTTKSPLLLLIFSILIGVLHVCVGLIIKLYILLKHKNFKEAIFNVLGWVLILAGAGIYMAASTIEQTNISKFLNIKMVYKIGVYTAIVGAVSILIFSGYKNKGIMKILGGLINLYGITSYISDVLSYSRLMALGIATGVIANVVNILASMSGPSFFGAVLFVIIASLGHSLNFGINILGAYVHTNRLQYVEFFSKFYVGGGRAFSPFGMHTKYINFIN